jgi:hypothetical protein
MMLPGEAPFRNAPAGVSAYRCYDFCAMDGTRRARSLRSRTHSVARSCAHTVGATPSISVLQEAPGLL